jgi:hypothetical protein
LIELDVLTPPTYCHYVGGPCDQAMVPAERSTIFFAYPSTPEPIAATIEEAVGKLRRVKPSWSWLPWKDLPVAGQTIFCEICKSIRRSATVIADVTTLNFNLLFEIGYTIGLGVPVIPIRDTSYKADQRVFDELGLLDTIGYVNFSNSRELADALLERVPAQPLAEASTYEFRETPLYVMKGPIETEGAVQMMSAIKKSRIKFRTYDPVETPRLSIHEAKRQVMGSTGVIANLLDVKRGKALQHNGQCALICGLALSQQKAVAMVQEGEQAQPIDYRDIVQTYRNPNNIPGLLQPVLHRSLEALQDVGNAPALRKRDLLQSIDLGDVAAENEIGGLRRYFVVTGQSSQAKQGNARLVVGRKGSGKTAVFYDVRNYIGRGHDRLVLDMKPEGHQFTKLREMVLEKLGPGLQEHTMVAFWNYILLGELARKALDQDRSIAKRDPVRFAEYEKLQTIYLKHDPGGDFDFSQRLLMQVDRVTRQLGSLGDVGAKLTEVIYSGDFRRLTESVSEYLRTKDTVWLLVDNLDKGWPVRGVESADILIVRSLLDATRKLQRQLETEDVDFNCLVFLRSDIYDKLREDTPDKGKDTAIRLDWEDPTLFEEIVRKRISQGVAHESEFSEAWRRICTPLVDGQGSFSYILDRTLMRPRDLLQFLREAMHTAINRSHQIIEERDILQAERSYSQDILLTTSFEIGDTYPDYADVLYSFEGAPAILTKQDVCDRVIRAAGVPEDKADDVLELLIWFGFLGVSTSMDSGHEKYSYDVQENMRRLLYPLRAGDGVLVVHKAFRAALEIDE